MIAQPAPLRVVLHENSGAAPLSGEARFEILRSLLERGFPVSRPAPGAPLPAGQQEATLVLGCGAAEEARGGEGDERIAASRVHDIEGMDAAAVVGLAEAAREQLRGPRPAAWKPWKPWFPVIDYDRCTNCMQCLSFCLFDVYGVRDGKIEVRNEDNCKTDCPACSRVCPEVAILFPKYRSGPINGDEIDPEDLRREAMKVDISALLGGDIYAALRDRSARAKSRFSKERDEDRALKERQRCLAKLQEQMDIPPEVLASLPSPDQILEKAARARERADAALAEARRRDGED